MATKLDSVSIPIETDPFGFPIETDPFGFNLLVQDVDQERGTLFVRQGKGKADRMIPIGERALLWIDKYLEETRLELACGRDEGRLFLSRYGEAYQP